MDSSDGLTRWWAELDQIHMIVLSIILTEQVCFFIQQNMLTTIHVPDIVLEFMIHREIFGLRRPIVITGNINKWTIKYWPIAEQKGI